MKTLQPLWALAACLTATLLGATQAAAADAPIPPALRVMSFNVRLALVDDGTDSWRYRKDLFLQTVADFAPDLVGFQEVVAEQHDAIVQRFPEYTFVGVAREDGKRKGEWALVGFQEVVAEQHDAIVQRFPEYVFVGVAREDGKRQGEWALVGFRRSRFDALTDGNFWLSEHPEEPGSKSWNTAWTRICTWVRLRDHGNGRVLLFANTHLDNESRWARTESCRLLASRLPAMSDGAPVVLTGDFNMNEDDSAFAPLAEAKPPAVRLFDSYRDVHPTRTADELTFHAFKGGMQGSRIDFILHSSEIRATAAAIVRTHSPTGHYPSDHYPVTAVLRLEAAPAAVESAPRR